MIKELKFEMKISTEKKSCCTAIFYASCRKTRKPEEKMFVLKHAINYLTTDDDSTKVPVFSSRVLLTCNREKLRQDYSYCPIKISQATAVVT